eukprot:15560_1
MGPTVTINSRMYFILIMCGIIVFCEIITLFVWVVIHQCRVQKTKQQEKLKFQKKLNEIKDKDINKHKGVIDFKDTIPSLKSLPSIITTRGSIPGEIRKLHAEDIQLQSEMKQNSLSNISDELFQEGEQPHIQQIADVAPETSKLMRSSDPQTYIV